ncbi:MAG: SDR family oxidoreductase [Actinobacteria bacterium]|jgi:short-subunit dehydrogenase|nr:SDR family oxidoreductase [Actinomycetota bacterium]
MKTALITGATAGIGESFARLLARNGYNLILVARDLDRLNQRKIELRELHPQIKIELLKADLTVASDLNMVSARAEKGIDLLINNAGFGINKTFTKSEFVQEQELLDLLVKAPMQLTHSALPAMLNQGSGAIINVSSIASWIAGGTYSAAKSYLTVFSESLHSEVKDSGIKVLSLCPGFTRTEFHQRGRMRMNGLPNFLWLSADQVSKIAWRDLQRGRVISVPGWQYKIISSIVRFGPRPLVRKIGMNIKMKQRQRKDK